MFLLVRKPAARAPGEAWSRAVFASVLMSVMEVLGAVAKGIQILDGELPK